MPDLSTQAGANYLYGHQTQSFASNIGRGQTAATVLFTIPPQSTIIDLHISGAKSNAGSSAYLAIGSSGGGGSEFLTQFDVKNIGVTAYPSNATLGYVNDLQPIAITGVYTETGSASNSGGPWLVVMEIGT